MPTLTIGQLKQKKQVVRSQIAEIEKAAQSKIKPLKQQLEQFQAELKRLCPHRQISRIYSGRIADYWCEDCGSDFSSDYNKKDREFLLQRGIYREG